MLSFKYLTTLFFAIMIVLMIFQKNGKQTKTNYCIKSWSMDEQVEVILPDSLYSIRNLCYCEYNDHSFEIWMNRYKLRFFNNKLYGRYLIGDGPGQNRWNKYNSTDQGDIKYIKVLDLKFPYSFIVSRRSSLDSGDNIDIRICGNDNESNCYEIQFISSNYNTIVIPQKTQ